jgi:hypothetical protein
MLRQSVASSTIRSVGYERTTGVLEVEFARGGIYQYLAVPEFLFRGFMLARSKGRYFNERILKRYEERQVDR